MKRDVNLSDINQFRTERYKKRLIIAVIILIIGFGGFFAYFKLFVADKCDNISCYETALFNCKKIWFMKDDEKYVWRYEILGSFDSNSCNVEVRLIRANKGGLDIEEFQGKKMVCKVQKVDDIHPEKDMLRCSGDLKESLQEIIINRMHNYLLQNLGEIQEGLKAI